ncbi:MAG: S-adenosylmethionine:tRNA ribosyltransferase-isomerase, partial [Planctomycetes bacterium]|nr:S-adenosylmethionine:tRNA ribosyltransferase-isomerase [Planctomycetota bacterium]
FYRVSQSAADSLNAARREGRRVIAVGTTSTRTLESVTGEDGITKEGEGWTGIFIRPGYRFKAIDGLLTNFHLPKSSLIVLVSALAGREYMLSAYAEAVREGYRFYSYGDAMLILPRGEVG